MASRRASERESVAPGSPAPSSASAEKLLERVPPFDETAEAGVLGSMLMDARAADVAIEELKPEDFYLPRHRVIFTVFSHLFQKHESIDELYLCSELERQGMLEAAGGRDAIGRLILQTPTAANIESYCTVVRNRAVERELIAAAGTILRMVNEPTAADGNDQVESAEKLVYEIADRRSANDAVKMTSLMEQALAEAEQVQAARREGRELPSPALPTHYADLDRLLSGGLWPGELIVIAGRPSMGKTTFALNIARQVSVGNESLVKPSAVFSLEMPKEQVAKNILSAVSGIPGQKMRRFDLTPEEFDDFQNSQKALREAPIFIDDSSALSVSQVRARCRRLRHRHSISLVIVDYLQLMRGSPNAKSREQEVAEISRGLKAIARDLQIPVIVLSQLNRSAERRENEDKRPQLSDLRESGAIEQDADIVIMLYRPEYYDLEGNEKTRNTGEALVMKNRNGPVGRVQLTFQKDILRFQSYAQQPEAAAGS
jgi:replicative DNA helicase